MVTQKASSPYPPHPPAVLAFDFYREEECSTLASLRMLQKFLCVEARTLPPSISRAGGKGRGPRFRGGGRAGGGGRP